MHLEQLLLPILTPPYKWITSATIASLARISMLPLSYVPDYHHHNYAHPAAVFYTILPLPYKWITSATIASASFPIRDPNATDPMS